MSCSVYCIRICWLFLVSHSFPAQVLAEPALAFGFKRTHIISKLQFKKQCLLRRQAFSCEACSSMRPPSKSAAQEDGFAASSINSAQTNGNPSQGEDKGKKKGKAPKFERLRLTGESRD